MPPPGNIVEQFVDDGDDFGPVPLQKNVQPSEVYEDVVDFLNTSSSSNTNATSAINELRDITEILREQNNLEATPEDNVPISVMTINQTTTNFDQYYVVAERGEFVNMTFTNYVWARTFPTIFYPIFYNGSGLYLIIYLVITMRVISI